MITSKLFIFNRGYYFIKQLLIIEHALIGRRKQNKIGAAPRAEVTSNVQKKKKYGYTHALFFIHYTPCKQSLKVPISNLLLLFSCRTKFHELSGIIRNMMPYCILF